MSWINYPLFGLVTILSWFFGMSLIFMSAKKKNTEWPGRMFVLTGILILILFLTLLWIRLERPPLRTLGETRLWYSLFLPVVGFITYLRWHYKWFLSYALGLASLFLIINYLHPETYDKTLMPALQSPWFVPHVIVYIFAYALLAASSLVAIKGLYQVYYRSFSQSNLRLADNLVYLGFSFLTLGLLFGALWAKEAWGHYWTWDPKETWALLTWLSYLIYMHFRTFQPKKVRVPLWILSLAFIVLLICWFGLNYLPSAENSVHVYGTD
jgi:ABC-type transport system involved in cytochrome c biogenesis permease subunit